MLSFCTPLNSTAYSICSWFLSFMYFMDVVCPCSGKIIKLEYPTGPFTILEPRDQEIAEFDEVQERRATDFKAPKL